MSRKSVQGRARFGETNEVEVAVIVHVKNGRFVDGQTHQWQFLSAGTKVPAGCERQRIGLERWDARRCGGIAVNVDAVLVAGEEVGKSVAIKITQEHPVLEGWPSCAPVRSLLPASGFGLFEYQNPAAIAVKSEQVHVAVPIHVDFRPLRSAEATREGVGHLSLTDGHLGPLRQVPAPRGLPNGCFVKNQKREEGDAKRLGLHVGKLSDSC